MMGNDESPGVILNGLQHLFCAAERRSECKFDFSVTMVEIYNETVRDLLLKGKKDEKNDLDIKQDAQGWSVSVRVRVRVRMRVRVGFKVKITRHHTGLC